MTECGELTLIIQRDGGDNMNTILNTRRFVEENRSLFEKVNKDYKNMRDTDDVEYSILDYEKILGEMCEYIESYIEYKKKAETKYAIEKVISSTIHFYDTMFTDEKKYRHKIVLADMKNINKGFLVLTKKLQTLMESLEETAKTDNELKQLLCLSDNQYKKLSKVYRDDMKIYLWLSTSNSKVYKYDIDVDLRVTFNDKSTPVIHRA